jgi:hypothetical protein
MSTLDTESIVRLANSNATFRLAARYWTARVAFDIGDDRYLLEVDDGTVTSFVGPDAPTAHGGVDVRVSGPADSWDRLLLPVPPPGFDHIAAGMRSADSIAVEGDLVGAVAPYFAALQEFVGVLREVRSGPPPVRQVADVARAFDTAVGRYVYVRIHDGSTTSSTGCTSRRPAGAPSRWCCSTPPAPTVANGATCSRTPTTSACSG